MSVRFRPRCSQVVICQQCFSTKLSRRQTEAVEVIAILEGSDNQQIVFHFKNSTSGSWDGR